MESKVHRVRYYNPKPQPINCASFNKTSKLLAVSRVDASIEIWDLSYAPFLIKFIPGVENGSIEALGWVQDRLLSTGLGGALIEWDLDKLCLKTTVLLTGYAAWCLDVNLENSLVAVGTEQGYVNLYNVKGDDIVYEKLFDKQEGRIMCCKFDNTGNILVTGSIDNIRVWNVVTGHAISRMLVSRRGRETIVWCLAILADNVIVSGDSCGRLTFWDSINENQIESYSTHKADILTIAISDDEKSIYCSGVDPVIVNFIKVNKNTGKQTGDQWVKNVQRNIHEHDVRALLINADRLVSVGADGYLTLSSYPPKWVMRIPPMVPMPRSSVCASQKLLLLRFHNHLEVWKLGLYAQNNSGDMIFSTNVNAKQIINQNDNQSKEMEEDSNVPIIYEAKCQNKQNRILKLTEKPIKLVSVKSKGNKQIRCCELSPSGEFIVYSTDSDLRMLKLNTDDDQANTSVSKVSITGVRSPCTHMSFSEESRLLVINDADSLLVLQIDPEVGATVVQTIAISKYLKVTSILHLLISKRTTSDNIFLVVADTKGAITVWIQTTKNFEYYVTLPTYRCVPSAITIDKRQDNLLITYVDQKIVEYSLKEKKVIAWPDALLPKQWVARKSAVIAIRTHPRNSSIIFQDDTSLWVLDKSKTTKKENQAKKKPDNKLSMALNIIPIKYLAGFHWIGDDEAVTLEILPENIVAQLPPVLSNKKGYI